jgi:hypothetical protein
MNGTYVISYRENVFLFLHSLIIRYLVMCILITLTTRLECPTPVFCLSDNVVITSMVRFRVRERFVKIN